MSLYAINKLREIDMKEEVDTIAQMDQVASSRGIVKFTIGASEIIESLEAKGFTKDDALDYIDHLVNVVFG